ncbi:MAG: hypothetical protein M1821_001847 [Bathelium mastoideum]|nr:MAG: hypothetical protein M1821_001847 [Bathelium mastoideum]
MAETHEKLEHLSSENGLTRQVTVQMSAEQYERLFFQPTPPRGDLAKRLGNPTLLGVLGFLIPYTTTMMVLMEWRGTDSATSGTGLSGTYFFLGGIAMNIAGICEFILGNTFPFAVFIIYGSHWCNLGYLADPAHNIVGSFKGGATDQAYASSQGVYNVVMTLISFVLFLGSMRTNAPFCLALLCLIFVFSFLAAAEFAIGYATTPEALDHATYLIKIGGGFGFVTALAGWYLAINLALASTGIPSPLPTFDLSHLLFRKSQAATLERGRAEQV